MVFGNGVDIITDFTTTDRIGVTAVNTYTLLSVGSNATSLTAGNHYGIIGTYSAGTFTVNAGGADTLLLLNAAAANFDDATQTGMVILVGMTTFSGTYLLS